MVVFAVASNTTIQTNMSVTFTVPLIIKMMIMSNTINQNGLTLMIATTAIICSVIIAIDTDKRSVKIASHFSVLKVPSVISKRMITMTNKTNNQP